MFLIFALNRPDVLPASDLGVRVGLKVPPRAGRAAAAARVPRTGRSLAAISHHRQLVYLERRRYAATTQATAAEQVKPSSATRKAGG